MDVGLLVIRAVVGLLFFAHGTQKLFGWFEGYGLAGTAGFMGQLRYRNPTIAALAAGTFETVAGLMLAFGLFTPLAAAAIIGVMINAIVSAKWSQGFIGGYEIDVLYASVPAGLAFTGAGAFSIDRVIADQTSLALSGSSSGLIALGLGLAVALVVLASRGPAVEHAAEAYEQRAA